MSCFQEQAKVDLMKSRVRSHVKSIKQRKRKILLKILFNKFLQKIVQQKNYANK